MTEKELEEIDARAKAATEGPWRWRPFGGDWHLVQDSGARKVIISGGLTRNELGVLVTMSEGDPLCDFIAKSREDVPKLVAEVRRLRGFIHYVNDLIKFRKPGTTERVGPKELDDLLDNWEPENKKNPSF